MLFKVKHVTTYTYSEPVFIEPHIVRLKPRSDGSQHLESYELSVTPEPHTKSVLTDSEGNDVVQLAFLDLHPELRIESHFQTRTHRENPFDYLLPANEELTLPFQYDEHLTTNLEPYRRSAQNHTVKEFAEQLAREANQHVVEFLNLLNTRLFETMKVIVRDEGEPYPAEKTLLEKTGACRDLVVLFMEACRSQGIAARFVSGYQKVSDEPEDQVDEYDLHAWVEAYLPTGGWRGYDPTQGFVVADRHIAVAASHTPSHAAPITGSFRSSTATVKMSNSIEIETNN